MASNKAIQLQHVRDYAFTELRGGTKGESADYLLYDNGSGDQLQYLPVTSKIKLLKRRKTSLHNENEAVYHQRDQGGPSKSDTQVSYIVMAGRALSRPESDQV